MLQSKVKEDVVRHAVCIPPEFFPIASSSMNNDMSFALRPWTTLRNSERRATDTHRVIIYPRSSRVALPLLAHPTPALPTFFRPLYTR